MEQIVQQAQSIYEASDGPILSIWVQFQFGLQLRKSRVAQLASKIAEIVSVTPVGVNEKMVLRNGYGSVDLLPGEIDSIRISRSSARSKPAQGQSQSDYDFLQAHTQGMNPAGEYSLACAQN